MAVIAANSHLLCRDFHLREQQLANSSCSISLTGLGFSSARVSDGRKRERKVSKREVKAEAFWQEISRPISVEMEPITGPDHFDQVLLDAQERCQPIIVDWMAAWCRKCIYLKPKLEKLAAEYHTKIKFYFVDVNKVPQALVKRGNISKMPTIQLWKDGEMKAEVIGGHKAWLVVDEVREMIQKYM